jgi:rhomboid-like protein
MNCCSLGVNAFRPSVQIAAHQLSRPWTRFARTVAAPSARFFSIWPSAGQQQAQQRCSSPRSWASLAPSKPPLPICRNVRALATSPHAIITRYIDIPATYTDETGLPFRRDDLSPAEVLKLFGSHMSTGAGNRLLRILHGRRVAGTLEEPELQVNTAMYSEIEIKIALNYLRRTVQVDEITNAGLRAEDELAALEGGEETSRDAGKIPEWLAKRFGPKLYKTTEGGRGVYEKGAFDAIREKNRLKWEARLKQQEEEEKRRKEEEEAGIQSGELVRVGDRAVGGVIRKPSPQMQKWVDKAQSDLEAPPEMSKWERILPSAVVVGIFTCLLVAYAAYYRPLKRSDRLWPDIPPAAATVGAIMLANLAVYAAWKIPPFWGLLNRYFILVAATPAPETHTPHRQHVCPLDRRDAALRRHRKGQFSCDLPRRQRARLPGLALASRADEQAPVYRARSLGRRLRSHGCLLLAVPVRRLQAVRPAAGTVQRRAGHGFYWVAAGAEYRGHVLTGA